MTTPWWYSGEERPADSEDPTATPPAWDPSALLAMANQVVDWATERFIAPHAEHTDPTDNPNCVLCRSAAVLGTVTEAQPPDDTIPMTWIPVRRVDAKGEQRGAQHRR